MGIITEESLTPEPIAPNRTRTLVHTDHLMMVVIDFRDGPCSQPDVPHKHPHEQVSYVAVGEVNFFYDGVPAHLKPGDMITIPPDVPHCVQPLTPYLRLIDTFTPIREDFLKKS